MHNLEIEKALDKLGNKYEAVVKMSLRANEISDEGYPEGTPSSVKVTQLALMEFMEASKADSQD
jgi:DNA-directed RNA polymerase subunit K/omega